ncbi:hypothetical protein MC7420_3524 [Coleofasciculus chthonoplastes PCC 7420]|uniref:Uncharacterized protein n=1 Tax=Coleofasciculus chthonoplastes PCC 7420 TaxID=118168 RepID=B4VZY7_9CYAN|nr:hypothetical protein MC7420_3524 [Coleofasciculus chthonoplastes PCC 7420]
MLATQSCSLPIPNLNVRSRGGGSNQINPASSLILIWNQ